MFGQYLSVKTPIPRISAACSLLAALAGAAPALADDPIITPGAELVQVYAAARFMEGPTWDPFTAKLYFTSLTGGTQILRLDPPNTVTVWRNNSHLLNGTFLSLERRLLCAHSGAREILSLGIGWDGPEDPIVLASDPSWLMPNDLCQTPSGDIYFTTPDFGGGPGSFVYHLSPEGAATPVVTDMVGPNGVIASNDGQTLYVSDSPMKWWRSYPIQPDGSVGPGSLFFNPSTSNQNDPDGMTIDEFGNLYFTGRGGVWIVSPAGQQLEMVPVPVFCSNVAFGGVEGKTLYITCDGKLYSLSMEVRGALWQGIPSDNQPPQVDAGADQTFNSRTDTAQLDATVTDDCVPSPPGEVSTTWRKASGPGEVTFGNASQVDTTATFSEVGTYVLQLVAFDGIRSAIDEVTIAYLQAADFDGDGDVDGSDAARFETCLTGANAGPPPPDCELVDVDDDNDVDMTDFGLFQRCLTGQGAPADPHCAD